MGDLTGRRDDGSREFPTLYENSHSSTFLPRDVCSMFHLVRIEGVGRRATVTLTVPGARNAANLALLERARVRLRCLRVPGTEAT